MDISTTQGLLDLAGTQYKRSAVASGAGAFSDLMGSYLDYTALNTSAGALKTQASNIELQAKQQANMLREQFISAVGSYQFMAANRGVAVGSGSVRANIENSAIAMGQDIQRAQKVASMKASALRTQAKMQRDQAKHGMISSILGTIGTLAGAYGNFQTGAELSSLSGVGGASSLEQAQTAVRTNSAHQRMMSLRG